MDITELETPCLILDKGKFIINTNYMRTKIEHPGIKLRPHGKTAKSIDVMSIVLGKGKNCIAVSTLKEAEYYFENGINDILYAVGIAPVKLERIAELIKKGAEITIVLDSVAQAKAASLKAKEYGITFPVLIEIDSDGHRSGITVNDPLLLELGNFINKKSGIELKGVMTHAGESYNSKSVDDIKIIAAQERDISVKCAETLRNSGLPCPVVSIGSTPTAVFSGDLTGVTEVRSGVYMFYDLTMAGLDVCRVSDIAVSALTSVIGHQKEKGWIITDAGWMALSRDRSTAKQKVDQGYGLVCDINGVPVYDLIVKDTNQEHGIITSRCGSRPDISEFTVGTPLRILPNHACATGAMYDKYFVVDGSTAIIDIWPRINGW